MSSNKVDTKYTVAVSLLLEKGRNANKQEEGSGEAASCK